MCEAVDTFREALAEHGLDADVAHESNDNTKTFYVSKRVGGETITQSTSIYNNYGGEYSKEKRLAIAARAVAEEFEKEMTENMDWNGRHITLRPYDGPEAICDTCGATVELSSPNRIFAHTAELSTPQPHPVTDGTVLGSLDDNARVLLKMYLIGKLRDACDYHCPNSNRKICES